MVKEKEHFLNPFLEKYDQLSAKYEAGKCKNCPELKGKKDRIKMEADNREKALKFVNNEAVKSNIQKEIAERKTRIQAIDDIIARHCKEAEIKKK